MAKPRVLIVEDETIVAMDIQRGLTLLGYSVVATCETGAEAVRLAEAQRPDLVLMDIQLQGPMDGIEAGREIRQRFRIPIVFLTAYADASTVERAKVAEPFGYLLKPFEDQELHSAIEMAMHKRQAEADAAERADEALRQSEERFQMLVESLSEHAVFLLDTRGHIVTWNPGAQRLEGYAETEVIGQHFALFYRPEEIVRNRPDQVLWRAAQEGRTHDEGWRVRKDGSRFWADVVITALHDRSGQLAGFAEITRDVTEKRRAEEEIRQLNSTLEQRVQERTAELDAANRELEAFTYSVAHDLRGPLRGIRGFLGILQEELGPGLSRDAAAHLDRSASCADRMSRLIDDLLNLARLGKQSLHLAPVALDQLVAEALADLGAEAQNRPVVWRIDPLPVVECDAGLMKQVFVNLLANALKYTRSRVPAVIEVGLCERQGEPAVFVRDNGVGFSMNYADKLFKPFSRLHGEEFPGTGVGLATVERIIRRHSGHIAAEAAEERGATFYFTLGTRCAPAASPETSVDVGLAA